MHILDVKVKLPTLSRALLLTLPLSYTCNFSPTSNLGSFFIVSQWIQVVLVSQGNNKSSLPWALYPLYHSIPLSVTFYGPHFFFEGVWSLSLWPLSTSQSHTP